MAKKKKVKRCKQVWWATMNHICVHPVDHKNHCQCWCGAVYR